MRVREAVTTESGINGKGAKSRYALPISHQHYELKGKSSPVCRVCVVYAERDSSVRVRVLDSICPRNLTELRFLTCAVGCYADG